MNYFECELDLTLLNNLEIILLLHLASDFILLCMSKDAYVLVLYITRHCNNCYRVLYNIIISSTGKVNRKGKKKEVACFMNGVMYKLTSLHLTYFLRDVVVNIACISVYIGTNTEWISLQYLATLRHLCNKQCTTSKKLHNYGTFFQSQ